MLQGRNANDFLIVSTVWVGNLEEMFFWTNNNFSKKRIIYLDSRNNDRWAKLRRTVYTWHESLSQIYFLPHAGKQIHTFILSDESMFWPKEKENQISFFFFLLMHGRLEYHSNGHRSRKLTLVNPGNLPVTTNAHLDGHRLLSNFCRRKNPATIPPRRLHTKFKN